MVRRQGLEPRTRGLRVVGNVAYAAIETYETGMLDAPSFVDQVPITSAACPPHSTPAQSSDEDDVGTIMVIDQAHLVLPRRRPNGKGNYSRVQTSGRPTPQREAHTFYAATSSRARPIRSLGRHSSARRRPGCRRRKPLGDPAR